MREILDYSLADFLLFSPDVYFRLFELYNFDVWPAQLASPVAGLLICYLVRDGRKSQSRIISLCLAAIWLWVGYAFHALRYATINDWAILLTWACVCQAAVFLWAAAKPTPLRYEIETSLSGLVGTSLLVWAVFLYPSFAFLTGRNWTEAEFFGFAPDPTTVATFGLALLAAGHAGWVLLPVPLILTVISAVTALAMGTYQLLLISVAGIVATALMVRASAR